MRPCQSLVTALNMLLGLLEILSNREGLRVSQVTKSLSFDVPYKAVYLPEKKRRVKIPPSDVVVRVIY